jgi:hypothetical protein
VTRSPTSAVKSATDESRFSKSTSRVRDCLDGTASTQQIFGGIRVVENGNADSPSRNHFKTSARTELTSSESPPSAAGAAMAWILRRCVVDQIVVWSSNSFLQAILPGDNQRRNSNSARMR